MEVQSIEAIVSTLNSARVDYLIVGGLAVNAHGFVRLALATLLAMKRAVGRPQDLIDVEELERMR